MGKMLAGCNAILLAVVPLIFASQSLGATSAGAPSRRVHIARGELLFHQQCLACHNKQPGDSSPFGPPNLHALLGRNPVITQQHAVEVIRDGKSVMPAFRDKLSDGDIRDIIAYLKTH
jgi:mono/diheme cytochrome c family protein